MEIHSSSSTAVDGPETGLVVPVTQDESPGPPPVVLTHVLGGRDQAVQLRVPTPFRRALARLDLRALPPRTPPAVRRVRVGAGEGRFRR